MTEHEQAIRGRALTLLCQIAEGHADGPVTVEQRIAAAALILDATATMQPEESDAWKQGGAD